MKLASGIRERTNEAFFSICLNLQCERSNTLLVGRFPSATRCSSCRVHTDHIRRQDQQQQKKESIIQDRHEHPNGHLFTCRTIHTIDPHSQHTLSYSACMHPRFQSNPVQSRSIHIPYFPSRQSESVGILHELCMLLLLLPGSSFPKKEKKKEQWLLTG